MIIYAFNASGRFTFIDTARINPENTEDFLIPSYRTNLKPPPLAEKEFAVFKTNMEGVGDTRIPDIKCEWIIFDEDTSILENGVYRKKTLEELNVDLLESLRKIHNDTYILDIIQDCKILLSDKTYASNSTKLLYDCIRSTELESNLLSAEYLRYNSKNVKEYMTIIRQVSNDIYTVLDTYCYDSTDFKDLFGNDPRNVYSEFGSGFSYVFTKNVFSKNALVSFDRSNLSINIPSQTDLRNEGIIPPSKEDIWKKVENQWTIETTKLNARKEELAEELYNYRISVQEYYKVEVNGIVFRQRWTEYDYGRILAQINMNDDDYMLAWRFSGVDLTQTTMISISQLRDIYKQGEYNETCCSLAQYLVYYKLLGLTDTTDFDLKTEFDKDLVFVKENYETVVVSLKETFTEIINSKNNSNTSTDISSSEETTTSETTEEVKTEESVSETSSSEETTETSSEDTNGSTL